MGQQLNLVSEFFLEKFDWVKALLISELFKLDPKPSDLIMNKLKVLKVRLSEGLNSCMLQNTGMICD